MDQLIDRVIREARERGEWDDTAYRGRPLPPADDERYAGDMAVGNRLLRNAGVAPPWIETDKLVRRLIAEIDALRAQLAEVPVDSLAAQRLPARLAGLVTEHDAAVEALNAQAPSPRQHRRRLGRA